jgi:hypothetical protein
VTTASRKVLLTVHVVSSVGWLGAVVASLALGLAGLFAEPATSQASYISLELLGWTTLLPLAVASLVTGIVQSFASSWGLLRHYWVVVKLWINLIAAVVLLLYMGTLGRLADSARSVRYTGSQSQDASPTFHSLGALLLLIVATLLSVLKPRGLTRHGARVAAAAP